MKKKDTKQQLFENMKKLNPDFVNEQVNATGNYNQAKQQYTNNEYKILAPQLKMVNTPEKFAPAFKQWFQYLGYSPQANNISIQRVRMDVENVLKQLGYK